ncbi:conserved phage C-terminal domain-containing protein [Clostridium grantii]|uniref:Phage conserved hypothetical protein C-terminal domain-containing protein n=1 Tax=Clostridium grantii DSM 8605 TaxID=1121316 RepID=A0A1M5XMH2_9CLOT|nr:conserved phage C-terminal domain-containing protein [Clostridium grantii]SHI01001.1 phage conserved hypothetical protein, C-terminal domain-containing protein [Clostridium grantii DSM 8605]
MNKIVSEVGKLNFTGNIINWAWFKNLTHDNGKANMNAIVILSEIIYWYRPTEVRDEMSGEIIRYKKKFKADKLQKSYQSLADNFGLTKGQAKAACKFLKDKGLITIEFRNIITSSGQSLSNIMFIEPIIEEIRKVSSVRNVGEKVEVEEIEEIEEGESQYKILARGNSKDISKSISAPSDDKDIDVYDSNVVGTTDKTIDVCSYNNTHMKFKPQTYTENTTEINRENTTEINAKINTKNIKKSTTNTRTATCKNIYSATITEIVDFLNLKVGTNYMSSTENTNKIIKERLKEGFKVEDFFKVINIKTQEWQGTDYEKFLRPQTLFGPKFEAYLNQKSSNKAITSNSSNKNTDGSFSNRQQRKYDLHSIEKGLLGWG